MKILVCSCDKNEKLWYPFNHCIEKYWPEHPEVIYSTETIQNKYYRTICKNYPLTKWTRRVRETVYEIDDHYILLMCDDVFINDFVINSDVISLENNFPYNCAAINLQIMSDDKRIEART